MRVNEPLITKQKEKRATRLTNTVILDTEDHPESTVFL